MEEAKISLEYLEKINIDKFETTYTSYVCEECVQNIYGPGFICKKVTPSAGTKFSSMFNIKEEDLVEIISNVVKEKFIKKGNNE